MNETGESKSKKKRTTSCCVPGCGTHTKTGISFHHFPGDEVLRKQWEDTLKLRRPASKFMRVCSDHFTEMDYFPGSMNTRPHLKRHAVPTRNLPENEPTSSQEYLMSLRKTMKQEIADKSPNDTQKSQDGQTKIIIPDVNSSTRITRSCTVAVPENIEHVEIKQEIIENYDPIADCTNPIPSIKKEVTEIEIKLEKEDEMSSEEMESFIDPSQHCEIKIEDMIVQGDENTQQRKRLCTHTRSQSTQTNICPIYGIITDDAKLEAFTGINTFEVLEEIVQRVAEVRVEVPTKRVHGGLDLKEQVLLTLVKLKLGLNNTALEALFGNSNTRCSLYFTKLTKLMFHIVENYSDEDCVKKQLQVVLKKYKTKSE